MPPILAPLFYYTATSLLVASLALVGLVELLGRN